MKTSSIVLLMLVQMIPALCFSQDPVNNSGTAESRMITAVKTGDSGTFDALLESNPSLLYIKEPTIEESLLHVAARNNQYEMVRKLLEKGLDVNAKNKLGSIPLHLACITGSYPMVDDLIRHGSDYSVINMRGKPPVAYISYGKNPELFNLFLAIDKTILNTRLPDGSNLLFCAIEAGDSEGFKFLVAHGVDVNAINDHRLSPLCWSVLFNNSEIVKTLISNGADINFISNGGRTAFLYSIERDSISTVKLLLDAGSFINKADSAGLTALHTATIRGNYQMASWLLNKGIRINSRDTSGLTALHYAAIYGRSDIGALLVQKGANVNSKDNLQHEPVYCSTWYGNDDMTKVLVKSGADKSFVKPPVLSTTLRSGEAVIHYLNHSSYAIETSEHLLVFDYFHYYSAPDNPSLLNGRIKVQELKGKKIVVFVSHEHGDHYDTAIWKWYIPGLNIHYVTGFRPEVRVPYEFAEPQKELTVEGVHINPIRSTDAGVGFLVEADGIVVYHPGDHVNKSPLISQDFKGEIDYLSGLNKKVDIAFLPVAGCGFPDLQVVKAGNFYVVEKLNPGISFSMHAEADQCAGFSKEVCLKFPGNQSNYSKFSGDRYFYTRDNSSPARLLQTQ